MKALSIVFILLLGCQPVFSGTTADEVKTQEALKGNVVDFRDWLIKQLSQFPKNPQRVVLQRSFASIPKKNGVFNANQFNQAAKSDWVKAQVMQGLSNLSQQLAKTAGTAFAPQNASQLQQYATQLKQSNDPQFQQIGTLYNQEAQALQNGDTQAAQQAASQVAALPQPSVPPGYQPTQGERDLFQTFNQVVSTFLNAAIQAIIAYYGGGMASSLFSQSFGSSTLGSANLGSANLGSAFGGGQNSGQSVNSTGTNTLPTNGTMGLQQLGGVNVKQLQTQGSSNAGGAPPAQ